MNTTQALHADQSKEEEFANIIEVSDAYSGIYEYLQLLLCIGSRLLCIHCLLVGLELNSHSQSVGDRDIPPLISNHASLR